jgi:hypothetical protein
MYVGMLLLSTILMCNPTYMQYHLIVVIVLSYICLSFSTVVYVVNKNALKKHPFSAQSHQININAKFKETEYKVTFWLCTH